MTRLRPLKLLGLLAAVALVVAGYMTLGPATIGGKTIYSLTYGTSMEPKLHKGDLVAVRKGGTPRVGDAALYINRDLKRHVLHRIIRVDGDRYVMKGDNNAFVDTYEPTRAEILGKLWFTVGGAGNVSGWLRQPTHTAAIAGLVALLSLLGGGLKAQRGRRKRRSAAGPGAWTGAAKSRSAGSPLSGQAAQVAGGVLGLVALACGVLALVAYSRPTTEIGDGPALYAQQGTFSYSARVPPGAVYEDGRLTTGQPAYLQVVRSLRIAFAYKLDTQAPHTTFGTTALTAEMANGSGWTRTFRLAPETAFSGDRASVSGVLKLAELRKLANRLEAVTGQVPDTYTITIRPTVQLHGAIDGKPVKGSFAPPLALALDRYKLTLPSSAAADTTLERAQDGPATKRRVLSTLSVLGATMQVQSARQLSAVIGLAALVGALGIGLVFLLGLRHADEPERIKARFGHLIVEIVEPRRRFPEHDVTMASFEDLVRVSDRHARMILHAQEGYRHIYLVEDDGVAYRFEAHGRVESDPRGTTLFRGRPGGQGPGEPGSDSPGSPADDAPAGRALGSPAQR